MNRIFVACLLTAAALTQTAFAADPAPFFRNRQLPKAAQPRAAGSTVVTNAASYEPGVSPGGLATIFGINLTSVSGTIVSNTDPLPTTLGHVNVIVNGIAAPIFSIAYANGEDQISFQVPYETAVGPNAARIRVLDSGFETANVSTDSFTEDPGIFMYQGHYAVALDGFDYSLIGPSNPAFPDDVVILYTTGLGPLNQNLRNGYGAPYDPLAYTVDPFQVLLDGEVCKIYFSGLAPGFAGLYQINFYIPRDARHGDLDLQIRSPYADSLVATLSVQ